MCAHHWVQYIGYSTKDAAIYASIFSQKLNLVDLDCSIVAAVAPF
jgi:hypothetical protein